MIKRKKSSSRYYIIESILGKRHYHGKVEYLIKWKGYSDQYNSWQPSSNVSPHLIEQFDLGIEDELFEKEAMQFISQHGIKKVINVQRRQGSIYFYVEWLEENINLAWISSRILNKVYPQMVIKFYESISTLVD